MAVNPEADRGLYDKYIVQRRLDLFNKHVDCRYFVLDPRHDEHARVALRAYAESVREEYPNLAFDLTGWLRVIES